MQYPIKSFNIYHSNTLIYLRFQSVIEHKRENIFQVSEFSFVSWHHAPMRISPNKNRTNNAITDVMDAIKTTITEAILAETIPA